MRFAIDVAFVDRENTVVHLLPNMKPWRNSRIVRKSRYVVELPAGRLAETDTHLGDILEIQPA